MGGLITAPFYVVGLYNWGYIVWEKLSIAFALFLIFEGILPFLSPDFWRRMMLEMSTKPDNTIRIIGLSSMVAGLLLLYFFK